MIFRRLDRSTLLIWLACVALTAATFLWAGMLYAVALATGMNLGALAFAMSNGYVR